MARLMQRMLARMVNGDAGDAWDSGERRDGEESAREARRRPDPVPIWLATDDATCTGAVVFVGNGCDL